MNNELPAPLVGPDVDLQDFAFMPLDVVRLRDSGLTAKASGDEFRAAVLLWCASWHQIPAASLPNDEAELANLCGYGRALKEWKKIREGALRGWVLCSDGRLYHPVVAEKSIKAWERHHRLRHAALRKLRPERIKGSRWQKIRGNILARDGYACALCGSTDRLEIDHIKPLAEGGTHEDSNLRVLCLSCNRRKSYKVAA